MNTAGKWASLAGLLVVGFTAVEFKLVDFGGILRLDNLHGPTVLVGSQKNEFKGPATDLSVALGILEKSVAEATSKHAKLFKERDALQIEVQRAEDKLASLNREYGEAKTAQEKWEARWNASQATIADLQKQLGESNRKLKDAEREAGRVPQLQAEIRRLKGVADDAVAKLQEQDRKYTFQDTKEKSVICERATFINGNWRCLENGTYHICKRDTYIHLSGIKWCVPQ